MKLKTLKKKAEKLIDKYVEAEMTSNFDYFIRKASGIHKLTAAEKFCQFPFTIPFRLAPASNYEHRIVYIPKIYLWFKKFSLVLAVHELLHIRYPELTEDEVNFLSRRLTRGQNN